MKLDGIREKVFLDRYSLKDEKGNSTERSPEEMWRRIAHAMAQVEKKEDRQNWEEKFYYAMQDFKYVPGGRILAGAGTGFKVTFYNCFVLPSPSDSRDGILDNLKAMIEIMARGGGVGINLSSLRPRGSRVRKVNGFSSGPCNWAELYSLATKDIIQQGGSRRGALMLMLWDWHPDVEEFITVKQDLARINGANLSVCVSDDFMKAVKEDGEWDLVFPDTNDPEYDKLWDGYLPNWLKHGKKVIKHKTVKARDLWNLIAEAAWRSAEPGVVFMQRYNKWSNNWYFNTINCVNPCVTGDTLVATTKGVRSIRSLYEEGLPFKAVVNGRHYLSTHVKLTGTKPVFRLLTKEGYELRLTQDHKVFTQSGKKEAGKLIAGEKILLSSGGAFGSLGSLEEGKVLGWLVGDGSMKEDVATLFFYKEEKKELAPQFALMVEKMVDGEQVVARPYPITPQYIEKEDKAVVESVRLWRIANRFGITRPDKYNVPEKVFAGSEEFQRGFLQGIFSSDGGVFGHPKKGVSVRLTSVSRPFLVKVQKLLLNFGILSRIYTERRKAQKRLLPDGKGGKKLYSCQAYHELVIAKESLIKFSALIGFLQEEKQNKLRSLLSLYTRGPYKEDFTAVFVKLEEDGVEEVFDITVADIHRFSANGLIVANCGEEGLPAWGVCNLGSLNLSAFVNGNGEMNYDLLAEHARIATRFQDNVVDSDVYVFKQIEETQLNGERRIGVGTMGLGDALIKMKLRYGSDKSIPVIEKIYKTIRDAVYEASVEIAKEKGNFPKFDAKQYLQGYFIKKLPKKIQDDIKKHGIRNSVLLQEAPTGSTSLLAGTTSGIEPVYEFEFRRRDRLGEHILYHPLYEEWKNNHPGEDKPDYFVSANELTPEDHVMVQAAIQKYVDASISKTVNAPRTHTVEDVKRLYTLAYDFGCKGIAYMREGSRAGVLERLDEKKESASSEESEKKEVTRAILKRPVVVQGVTYQTKTPVGDAFITINSDKDKNPFELFITIGKSGSDVAAMAEALGRSISLILRLQSHVQPREKIRQIIHQLSGIGGGRSVGFGENRVRSLPDAVAKVLAEHFDFKVNGVVKEKSDNHINGTLQKSETSTNGNAVYLDGNGKQKEAKQEELLYNTKELSATLFDLCPSCGGASLAFEEGCKKCYGCGYSEC